MTNVIGHLTAVASILFVRFGDCLLGSGEVKIDNLFFFHADLLSEGKVPSPIYNGRI